MRQNYQKMYTVMLSVKKSLVQNLVVLSKNLILILLFNVKFCILIIEFHQV